MQTATAPRQLIFILFLASMAGALWWTWSNFLLPAHTSVVDFTKLGETFRQCSRGALEADSVFWSPQAEHVRRVEAALPGILAGPGAPTLDALPEGAFFHRQYLGFKRQGEPMVLVVIAAYHDVAAGRTGAGGDALVSPGELAHACDAERSFWTLVYAPRTKKFEWMDLPAQ
jgi:hypothetical protein